MRRLAFIALLLLVTSAHASKVKVVWTNPTQNTDNSTITNLASVTIEWGACSNGTISPVQAKEAVPTTVAGAAMSTFAYPVALSPACIAAYATNTQGSNSALSVVVKWTPPPRLGQPISDVIYLHWSSNHASHHENRRHRRTGSVARARPHHDSRRVLRPEGLYAFLR